MTGRRRAEHGAASAVQAEYAQLAPRYDRHWRRYIEVTADWTVAPIAAARPGRVVDLGCGTGTVLARLSEQASDVRPLGVDASRPMLRRAREKLGRHVPLVAGDAAMPPLADGSLDTLVSSSVLHFLDRPEVALRAWYRLVRAGGRIVVTDWCRDYLPTRLIGWYLRLIGRRPVILSEAELVRSMQQAGFQQIELQRFRASWAWGLMRCVARKPADSRDA